MNLEELMVSTPPMQQHALIKGFQAGAASRDDEVATLRELKQLYQTERDQLRAHINTLTEALEFCSGTSYMDDAHKMANETLALIGSKP